jgi:hypothetical protein
MKSLRLFLRCAVKRSTVLRAVSVAGVITPILTAINHWGELQAGASGAGLLGQIGLTFLVPYCVSTFSSARAEMAHAR